MSRWDLNRCYDSLSYAEIIRGKDSAMVSEAEEVVAKRLPVCIIDPKGTTAVRAVETLASFDGIYGSRKKECC